MLANLVLAFRLVWAAGMGLSAILAAGDSARGRWFGRGAALGLPAALLIYRYRWLLGGREILEALVASALLAVGLTLMTRPGRRFSLLWGLLGFILPQAALWDLAEWPFKLSAIPAGSSFLDGKLLGEASGIALGLVLALAGLRLVVLLGRTWSQREVWPAALTVLAAYASKHLVVLGQLLTSARWWDPGILFDPLLTAINLLPRFPDLTLGLGLLWALCGLLRVRQPVPDGNPASVRKRKAAHLRRRKFAVATGILLFGYAVLGTWQQAAAKGAGQTHPPKHVHAQDGQVSLPRTELDDNRLHPYIYQPDLGGEIKFLAVYKGGDQYGLGLNYCQICGLAGYMTEGDQVICLRCGSAINRMTVGFPGGCNPWPIKGRVEGDSVVIAQAELDQHLSKFTAGGK